MQKSTFKNAKKKFSEKLITILVSEFENVFTAPDGVLMCQDDPPYEDPLKEDQSKGGDEAAAEAEEPAESFMYFIRTGQFRVKIK